MRASLAPILLLATLTTGTRADEPVPAAPAAPAPPASDVAPEPKLIHWSEASIKVRPLMQAADFPADAPAGAQERCSVRISIDVKGVPYEATPNPTCSALFAPSARAVALRYRFYPVEVDTVAVPATFDLSITFAR